MLDIVLICFVYVFVIDVLCIDDIMERDEDERSIEVMSMRDGKERSLDGDGIVEEDIDIDDPRSSAIGFLSSEFFFYLFYSS